MTENIKLLGISGSLRKDSANTHLIHALARLLPERVSITLFEGLDQLPHFNPGVEGNVHVERFRQAIAESDGVIICTPEYAFGVPGVLKNALDWTVSSGEFNEKPVAAISASPLNSGGDKALASLLLTLTALGTRRNANSSLSIPNIKNKLSPIGDLTDPDTTTCLSEQVKNLLIIIASRCN
jgi:chromate reductase